MSEQSTEKTVSIAEFEKEQEKRRRFESELEDAKRQLKEIGLSATEIKALKQAHDDLRKEIATKDPSGKSFDEELKRREADIRKEIQKSLDDKEAALSRLQGKVKELEVTDRVFSIAASKFNADVHDDVKAYIRKFGDLSDDGQIVFKDDNGKPRYAPGSTTELMKPEQFVDHLVSVKPSWASATIKAGTKEEGTKGSSTTTQTYSPDSFRGMDPASINKALESGGEAAARAYLQTVKL